MISIIIISFNTRELLSNCIRSVLKHCAGAEVIVVDNASQDGSARIVRETFPQVKLVELPDNRGFAGANNVGLKEAAGEFLLLLNSDTVVEDDSLQRCAQWMAGNPKLGAASPHLIGMDGRPQQCFYRFPSLKEKLRQALRIKPKHGRPRPQGVGWLAGTALMIRREALQQLGGALDDRHFMYWEDADFSARLLEAGWQVAEYPHAHVRHYGGASGGGPDAARRPDLYAWYAWGLHRWFSRHRPLWEAAGVWLLDCADVFRKFIRGLIHPGRRTEWIHARALAGVLRRRLFGQTPSLPGR